MIKKNDKNSNNNTIIDIFQDELNKTVQSLRNEIYTNMEKAFEMFDKKIIQLEDEISRLKAIKEDNDKNIEKIISAGIKGVVNARLTDFKEDVKYIIKKELTKIEEKYEDTQNKIVELFNDATQLLIKNNEDVKNLKTEIECIKNEIKELYNNLDFSEVLNIITELKNEIECIKNDKKIENLEKEIKDLKEKLEFVFNVCNTINNKIKRKERSEEE